jgi:3-dehydroquinate synthase
MTKCIQQNISLTFDYSVSFTRDIFHPDNRILVNTIKKRQDDKPANVFVILDSGVMENHLELTQKIPNYLERQKKKIHFHGPPLVLPGGEQLKNDTKWLDLLLKTIDNHSLCRHSYIIAIGGGALLDLAGYAAAIAHRGVRLIRVPTTVLAQNDSGVGVKNGVNAFGKKNFLGTFTPPYAVINDSAFLSTLHDRDWRSGIAEAIKVALIHDPIFFRYIQNNTQGLVGRDMSVMEHVIYRCAELHLNHISTCNDPFELGSSRPLDFGHWAAHRLEHLSGYTLRHGEAVAVGIALDTTYSYLSGMIKKDEWVAILGLLKALGFTLYVEELSQWDEIVKGLYEFQQHLGGELTLMLLEGIGRGKEVHEVDMAFYQRAVSVIKQYISV